MRKICAVTGSRAEYGVIYWVLKGLQQNGCDLHLIATGSHLSESHGMTVREIESDGFAPHRVDILLGHGEPADVTRSMGYALANIAALLDVMRPDIVLLSGDRYEMAAAAMAAAMLKIPIAHIGGGERTEGAIDDSLRHAITKLAYWHFAACDLYAQHIIQMGESPDRVFAVGAPGIDNLALRSRMSREEIERELGIELGSPVVLMTYHPETLGLGLDFLPTLSFPEGATLIVSGSNADEGGDELNAALKCWVEELPAAIQAIYRPSYGQRLWTSLLHECDIMIGNSSCALIEGMTLDKEIINIGDRQKGRAEDVAAIFDENKLALGVPGTVSAKIVDILLNIHLPDMPRKPFYHLK